MVSEQRVIRNETGSVIGLNLSRNGISDPNCRKITDIYHATLEILYLHYNHLNSIDLSPLAKCVNLKQLALCNNELTLLNLTPLAFCKKLERLYLGSNRLSSINLSPLIECKNLGRLSLSHNKLKSIDFNLVEKLVSLNELRVHDNPLDSSSCIEVCKFIEEHPDCFVSTDCKCCGKFIGINSI
ncbi:hypothetical protein JXI42_04880 [bacterium]|nr:hypothetical protein [bacterium]